MKKLFFTAFALSVALLGKAQLVEVASVERVAAQDIRSEVATISPDGTFAIVGEMGGHDLYQVNLSDGNARVITRNGNPSGVMISPDGNNVVFRTTSFRNGLRYTGLSYVDLNNGSESQLIKPSRKLDAGVSISAAGITTVEGGKARTKSFSGAKAQTMPVASINYGHLDITAGGKTYTLDPQGRGSYLWPSVSPDGTKVLYTLSGSGTFVCNLDGSNIINLGRLHAPRWMNNNLVVGMNDQDNGEFYTASSIVVTDLNGTRQVLSSDDVIALYPSVSADASRVLFTTAAGELYVINLK